MGIIVHQELPRIPQVKDEAPQVAPIAVEKELVSDPETKEDEIEEIVIDEPEKEPGNLEALVEETFARKETLAVSMHTHSYSGDRLWSDQKCPICRIKALPAVFESKEQQFKKDKANDKMLLTVSLEIDRELIRKARVRSCYIASFIGLGS